MTCSLVDDRATTALRRAVEMVEATSSVELVLAIRGRSGRWWHANAIVGASAASAALAFMLFSSQPFGTTALLADPLVIGLFGFGLVGVVPALKRWLTPLRVRRRAVERAAKATFVDRGIHHTKSRSGILIYVSILEGTAALVADRAVAGMLSKEELAALQRRVEAAMRQGGEAVAEVLVASAPLFASRLPRHAEDENELPNALSIPSLWWPRWLGGKGSDA